MNPFRWMRLRLRALAGRRALERDMQEEMRLHIQQAAQRYAARGMTREEAREAAMREFGNVGALQEQARDARGARWVEELGADLHFAFRYFGRKKLAAATIVIVLALGIGANTAIFSLIQAQFFRPAPGVADDPAHVRIHGFEQPAEGAGWEPRAFTYAELVALGERRQAFASVAAWVASDVVLNPGDSTGARSVIAEFVTPDYFATIGLPVTIGPGFARQALDVPDMAAVMSHALAADLYGDPATAPGRTVLVNEVPVRVVGVAPARFQGALPNMQRSLWLPVSARAEIARLPSRWLTDSAALTAFGRLAPDVREEQATSIARQVVAQHLPDSAARLGRTRVAYVTDLRAPPPIGTANDALVGITMVSFVGLLILLVACTNVTAMMVAAAVGRRQEIAVRLSLGATRWRLLRQLLTESSLLAVAAGALGLALYWAFVTWVASRQRAMQYVDLSPDFGTFSFMMAIALGTGILFGLSPALHATRTGVATALRESGSGATHRSRLQRVFVGAQIVLSQPLLVMLAVMLSLAWYELDPLPRTVSERVVAAGFRPQDEIGDASAEARRHEAVDSLVPRIAAHPEVVGVVPEAAAFTIRNILVPSPDDTLPLSRSVHVEGAAPGWFAMLEVPIVLGRDVSLADTAETDHPVVIGSDLARELWGDANPIGRTLASPGWRGGAQESSDHAVEYLGLNPDSMSMTVVGVYDAAHPTTRGSAVQRVYTARGKEWRRDVLLVRTRGSAERFLPELRRLIRAEAPSLPMGRVVTLAHIDAEERRVSLQIAGVVAGAGGLALLLASLGLYGVVSLQVQQRRREIGIRIAMGALPSGVARMFLASGVRVSAIALAIGLPLSLAGFRVLISMGVLIVPEFEPWLVGVGIAAVLLAVATAATWMPARQAARVDPARTLRVE
jgi:predicted permease